MLPACPLLHVFLSCSPSLPSKKCECVLELRRGKGWIDELVILCNPVSLFININLSWLYLRWIEFSVLFFVLHFLSG